ncbi:hypothetical protein C2G38_2049842 [Gigaspora rosea]|uniref:Uncharacterized protein n=1 Tax=Gigaspora rosea TaxID=44941 RepID=A0A397U113_9GLOM|nr:hypothetical protein C2G38_2049842 [Gigaspora rosea]
MFQQQATDIIIPDLHIIEQIRGANICSTTNQQVANKKRMSARNINDKSSLDQLGSIIINDPLVTKHRGQSPTKRLKSSSENQSHEEPAYINYAMNPQDSNLRVPLSNIDSNSSHAPGENEKNIYKFRPLTVVSIFEYYKLNNACFTVP